MSSAGHHEVTVYDNANRLGIRVAVSPTRVRIGDTDYALCRCCSSSPSTPVRPPPPRWTRAVKAIRSARRSERPCVGSGPTTCNCAWEYDDNRLEGLLDGWSAATDNGMVEGGLRIDGIHVVEIQPHAGQGPDPGPGARGSSPRSRPRPPGAHVAGRRLRPCVDCTEVAAAATRGPAGVADDITLTTGLASVVVKPAQLATTLGRASTATTSRSRSIPSAPRRRSAPRSHPSSRRRSTWTFVVTDQNTVNVVPSHDGRGIDMDAVATRSSPAGCTSTHLRPSSPATTRSGGALASKVRCRRTRPTIRRARTM